MARKLDRISARLDFAPPLDESTLSRHERRMSLVRLIAPESLPQTPANDTSVSVRDAQIQRALDALERSPAERWTVAKLAKVAALSRAAFARRFREAVGVPPLRHLASLRMLRAAELIATTDEKLVEIADAVGYANEFALSRAFRRAFGVPPSRFREHARFTTRTFAPRCLAA
jgi:transcriptional regulator GlxA family with amidase domain